MVPVQWKPCISIFVNFYLHNFNTPAVLYIVWKFHNEWTNRNALKSFGIKSLYFDLHWKATVFLPSPVKLLFWKYLFFIGRWWYVLFMYMCMFFINLWIKKLPLVQIWIFWTPVKTTIKYTIHIFSIRKNKLLKITQKHQQLTIMSIFHIKSVHCLLLLQLPFFSGDALPVSQRICRHTSKVQS